MLFEIVERIVIVLGMDIPNGKLATNPLKTTLITSLHTMYKWTILCAHVTLPIVIIYYNLMKINYNINMLTTSSFWIQYWGRILMQIYVCYVFIFSKDFLNSLLEEMKSLRSKWPKYGTENSSIKRKVTILLTLAVAFVFMPCFMVNDMLKNEMNRNVAFVWCAYVPPLGIHFFLAYFSSILYDACELFADLNAHFADIATKLSWREQLYQDYARSAKNVLRDDQLHDIFGKHDRLVTLVEKLHSIYSQVYLFVVVLALHSCILICYIGALDLVRLNIKQGIYEREHFFTEFWMTIFILDALFLVTAAHELNATVGKTGNILHQVACGFSHLNQYVSVYTFQILASDVSVNAGGFVDIEYSTIFSFFGLTLKYVFILLQFDIGDV